MADNFCYVDQRLNGPVHWLARRGKMCDGRAPHPLRLLAFADDADVDALLGQKCFQFVDANVRRSIPINGAYVPRLAPAEQSQGTEPGSGEAAAA